MLTYIHRDFLFSYLDFSKTRIAKTQDGITKALLYCSHLGLVLSFVSSDSQSLES